MTSTFRADLVPTWAKVAAWTVPLTCVPSVTWRLVDSIMRFVSDSPCGASGELLAEKLYVLLVLPAVQLSLALLTIGLIRPWGEVVPRWFPVLGGRRVPVSVAVGVAATGAILMLVGYWYAVVEDLWGPLLLSEPIEPLNPVQEGCPQGLGWNVLRWYLPMGLWPPLLLAVTWHYLRRRLRQARGGPA